MPHLLHWFISSWICISWFPVSLHSSLIIGPLLQLSPVGGARSSAFCQAGAHGEERTAGSSQHTNHLPSQNINIYICDFTFSIHIMFYDFKLYFCLNQSSCFCVQYICSFHTKDLCLIVDLENVCLVFYIIASLSQLQNLDYFPSFIGSIF